MSDAPRLQTFLGRYALILVGLMIALAVLNAVVSRFFGTGLPSGGTAIVPPMVAALAVGQMWAKGTGEMPESGAAWRFAGIGAIIYVVLQLGLVLFGLAAVGALGGEAMTIALMILAVLGVVVFFANRMFLSFGAKGILKRR